MVQPSETNRQTQTGPNGPLFPRRSVRRGGSIPRPGGARLAPRSLGSKRSRVTFSTDELHRHVRRCGPPQRSFNASHGRALVEEAAHRGALDRLGLRRRRGRSRSDREPKRWNSCGCLRMSKRSTWSCEAEEQTSPTWVRLPVCARALLVSSTAAERANRGRSPRELRTVPQGSCRRAPRRPQACPGLRPSGSAAVFIQGWPAAGPAGDYGVDRHNAAVVARTTVNA